MRKKNYFYTFENTYVLTEQIYHSASFIDNYLFLKVVSGQINLLIFVTLKYVDNWYSRKSGTIVHKS